MEIKNLIMIQDEYICDYEGHCPHCYAIFYLPSYSNLSTTKEKSVRQCSFCGGWVRLL